MAFCLDAIRQSTKSTENNSSIQYNLSVTWNTAYHTPQNTCVIVSFVCENLSQKKRDEDGFQYVVKV